MHCVLINQGRATDDCGKYHRINHLSGPDLNDTTQNFWNGLPCLFPVIESIDPHLPSRDIIGHGVLLF